MHYGQSSNPSLNAFIEDPIVDLANPFWKGYFKHLIGDLALYKTLDIKKKFNATWKSFENLPNAKELYEAERAKLHNDLDILNDLYINQYNITLP